MIVCEQDTAVVVLSYNGKKWHELFLPAIVAEAATGYDVIVADNASTDDTADYVRENFPTVKLLQIPVNRGFSNGYHEALKRISAKYYILLSADFEVTQGWYPPLISAMQRLCGAGSLSAQNTLLARARKCLNTQAPAAALKTNWVTCFVVAAFLET